MLIDLPPHTRHWPQENARLLLWRMSSPSWRQSIYCFIPVAVETLGAMGSEARSLFKDIAHCIKGTYREERAQCHEFLLQRAAVAVQRGNTASVLGTLQGHGDSLG